MLRFRSRCQILAIVAPFAATAAISAPMPVPCVTCASTFSIAQRRQRLALTFARVTEVEFASHIRLQVSYSSLASSALNPNGAPAAMTRA